MVEIDIIHRKATNHLIILHPINLTINILLITVTVIVIGIGPGIDLRIEIEVEIMVIIILHPHHLIKVEKRAVQTVAQAKN